MHGKTSASRFLKGAAVAALAAVSAGSALALEISLEENKASRGNIGYVDIHKVFRLFPETSKAKQSYQEIVRQAEEQVNLRKAELMGLRAELAKAKVEREILEKTPIPAAPPPPPAQPQPLPQATTPQAAGAVPLPAVPGALEAPGTTAPAAVLTSTQPLAPGLSEPLTLNRLPGMGASTATAVAQSTAAPAAAPAAPAAQKAPEKPLEPLVINIPGVTDKPIVVEAPGTSPMPGFAAPASPGAQNAQAAPAAAPAAAAGIQQAAALAPPPAAPQAPTDEALKARTARLAELDAKLKSMQDDLAAKEAAFRTHQAQLEKDLLDIENRRSELLLGKIYDAIREVAREAGVSVVVDKSQILFGQNSVDLTEKVVKKLQELAP